MKIFKLLILLLAVVSLGACKKEEVGFYEGGDRVHFKKLTTNTNASYNENRAYTFAGKGSLMTYDFVLPVNLMGRVAATDRPIQVEVDKEKTNAIEGVDFKIGPAMIPANANEGYITITLLNTEALETVVKTVRVKVAESADFKLGIASQLYTTISFYNFMVKPVDWETRMRIYFGDYSKVKHEFILFQLGIPEINIANGVPEDKDNHIYSGSTLAYFQLRLRSKLDDLNNKVIAPAPNDPFTYPLKDEKGNTVVFP
ncbi:DUF4843 domain-containing protein [Sphingobacterium psychroaquaticum]|uniref:DUF4843 domain-containing protein n=1 Tax=Sphingobacterium psychroaquaticum TaxID=561061 RepID=UPI001069552F|nr:DUF4843 domain-containing protein [Sphingobacterium psychroaquaticum]QBQ41344.1 DUF4843 domain-containing protein [Sphingobacterium psychroaquaticum]